MASSTGNLLSVSYLFSKSGDLVYCSDVNGLFAEFGRDHNPEEWSLFIDSSKLSLKAVLLHYGNIYQSVRVAYATHIKDTHQNQLKSINYAEQIWQICGDLRIIGLLKRNATRLYQILSCEWDSLVRERHYEVKEWPLREGLVPGEKSEIPIARSFLQNLIAPIPHKVSLEKFCQSYG